MVAFDRDVVGWVVDQPAVCLMVVGQVVVGQIVAARFVVGRFVVAQVVAVVV